MPPSSCRLSLVVTIALLLAAVLLMPSAASAQNCPTCPTCSVADDRNCPFLGLQCANNGTFPMTQCNAAAHALCSQEIPVSQRRSHHVCACEDDWTGSQCTIARDAAACPAGMKFDNNIDNEAITHSLECFLPDSMSSIPARNHRVDVRMDVRNNTRGTMSMNVWSMIPDETTRKCGKLELVLSCKANKCTVTETMTHSAADRALDKTTGRETQSQADANADADAADASGASSAAPPNAVGKYSLSCTNILCTSPVPKLAVVARRLGSTGKPTIVSFYNRRIGRLAVNTTHVASTDGAAATAAHHDADVPTVTLLDVSIFTDVGVTLPGVCQIGSCVGSDVVDAINTRMGVQNDDDGADTGTRIATAFSIIAVVVSVIVFVMFHRFNQRSARLLSSSSSNARNKNGGYANLNADVSGDDAPAASDGAVGGVDANQYERVGVAFSDVSYYLPRRGQGGPATKYASPSADGDALSASTTGRTGRQVLHSVSGVVHPGEMMCIIGGTGAGKTTLLDIIAGAGKTGVVNGNTELFSEATSTSAPSQQTHKHLHSKHTPGQAQRVSGLFPKGTMPTVTGDSDDSTSNDDDDDNAVDVSDSRSMVSVSISSTQFDHVGGTGGNSLLQAASEQYKRLSRARSLSYVMQDEAMLPTQTVRETVMFAARTRLPSTQRYGDTQINMMTDDVLDELRLTKVAHSLVGDTTSGGISGGERRRLALATELVCQCSVMLADEVTSGLDTTQADNVIRVLARRCARGMTCIATIHSPSVTAFMQFDRVLVLTTQGRVAFSGLRSDAMKHLLQLDLKTHSLLPLMRPDSASDDGNSDNDDDNGSDRSSNQSTDVFPAEPTPPNPPSSTASTTSRLSTTSTTSRLSNRMRSKFTLTRNNGKKLHSLSSGSSSDADRKGSILGSDNEKDEEEDDRTSLKASPASLASLNKAASTMKTLNRRMTHAEVCALLAAGDDGSNTNDNDPHDSAIADAVRQAATSVSVAPAGFLNDSDDSGGSDGDDDCERESFQVAGFMPVSHVSADEQQKQKRVAAEQEKLKADAKLLKKARAEARNNIAKMDDVMLLTELCSKFAAHTSSVIDSGDRTATDGKPKSRGGRRPSLMESERMHVSARLRARLRVDMHLARTMMNPADCWVDVASVCHTQSLFNVAHAFTQSPAFATLRADVSHCVGGASIPMSLLSTRPPLSNFGGLPHSRTSKFTHTTAQLVKTNVSGVELGSLGSAANGHDNNAYAGAGAGAGMTDARLPHKQARSQFALLIRRSLRHAARDPSLLYLNGIITTIVAVAVGLIYYDLSSDFAGAQNRAGLLFFIMIFFAFTSMSALSSLVTERKLFLRERAAGHYSVFSYFLSKLIADFVLLRVVPPIFFGSLVYAMSGMRDHGRGAEFGTFIVVLILTNLVATSFCFVVAASTRGIGQANMVATLYMLFCTIFGGFLLNSDTHSTGFVNLKYLSFFFYAYEAFLVNEFAGQKFYVKSKSFGNQPLELSGDTLLDVFVLKKEDLVIDIATLVGFVLVFWLFGYLSLLGKSRFQR